MFMVLKPPTVVAESSKHRPFPNKHNCIDMGHGNYTCTGSMDGMYQCISITNIKVRVGNRCVKLVM